MMVLGANRPRNLLFVVTFFLAIAISTESRGKAETTAPIEGVKEFTLGPPLPGAQPKKVPPRRGPSGRTTNVAPVTTLSERDSSIRAIAPKQQTVIGYPLHQGNFPPPEKNLPESFSPPTSRLLNVTGKWKSSEQFEISTIEGLPASCYPEEPIIVYVEGRANSVYVGEENGFIVSATLFNASDNKVDGFVKGEWISGAWRIELVAPKETDKKFSLSVHLACGQIESTCADEFGFGTQVSKNYPLEVR